MGILIFISGDASETTTALNRFIDLASKSQDDNFIRAAISAYAFCVTALPFDTITGELIPR